MINEIDNNVHENLDIIDTVMRLARTIKRSNHEHHHTHEGPGDHHGAHHGGFGRNRLLYVISNNNGASSRELAEILDIRPSSLTEMLSKLEQDGLIEKCRDEQDSRIVHVALTISGKELMHSEAALRSQYHLRISKVLSKEEQLQFCDYCQRLIDAYGEKPDLQE